MALGKAFIEVHADTKPFAQELGRELDAIIRASEKEVRVSSRRVGETISKETGEGIRRNRNQISKGLEDAVAGSSGFAARLVKGIIDTIDDGLSGLPAELKIALGAALVALLPVAVAFGAALASAITAGLALGGLAVIGVLLASQFTEVQDRAQEVFANIRTTILEGSEFFARNFLNALNLVERRFRALDVQLTSVFNTAARVIVPVTDALFGLVEEALPGFISGLSNIDDFLAPLQVGFRLIGRAVGDMFDTILSHPEAPGAFYDILIAVEDLVQVLTFLIDVGLDFYGVLKDIVSLGGLIDFQDIEDVEMLGREMGIAGDLAGFFGDAVKGTIGPTEAETEAIDELNQAIKLLTQLTAAQVSNEIAFQQGIDDLTESITKNKDTLNLHNQAGRDNARVLLELATTILKTRDDTIQLTGDVGAAERAFNSQRDEIYRTARQMGLTATEVDKVIGALLRIPAPKQAGVTSTSLSRLEDFNQALQETIYLQSLVDPTYNPRGPGGQQRFADGGIVTGPTNALIGEAGPEAVIPLTNPARAAQLLNESGLSAMASPTVNVYIGNEQLQAYIAVETNRQMAAAARAVSYGTRGF